MKELNGRTDTLAALSLKQKSPELFKKAVSQTTSQPADQLRAAAVRFAGKNWLAVQSMDDKTCSPTGNCRFWLFEMAERPQLRLWTDMVQTFGVIDGVRPELVLGSHGSAMETSFRTFSFNGTSFISAGCYDVLWKQAESDRDSSQIQTAPCIGVRVHQAGGSKQ